MKHSDKQSVVSSQWPVVSSERTALRAGGSLRAEGSAPEAAPEAAAATDDGRRTTDSPLRAVGSTEPEAIHDCWNVIGVEGNRTCRELVKFIHCRHCPVYSAAGLQLLDRPLPPDYRRERAEHYARQKKVAQPARLSVVIFRLGTEWLALPTTVFVEVVNRQWSVVSRERAGATATDYGRLTAGCPMHSLPSRARDRRGLALGLVNVRGELLVCASVARLLGVESEVRGQRSEVRNPTSDFRPPTAVFARLLVTTWNGQRLAFPVDELHGIERFPKDELKDPPATIARSARTFTRGVFNWHDRTVGLLDADLFFSTLNHGLAQ